MKNPTVLILGINGMTGYQVYNYLKINHKNVYGTSRKNKDLKLSVSSAPKDLNKIIKKIGKIDFLINCIGLNNVSIENKSEAIQVNSLFPIELSNLSKKYGFRVIHISTDAVFNKISGRVTEEDIPAPDSLYGITKLLGESESKNTINIRTSLIGQSPHKKTGLIEFVLNNKSRDIEGFINQKWSGCTTLQFAKFAECLIHEDLFASLRKRASIIHFAPIGPLTKYELISSIVKISKLNKKVVKTKSSAIITRYLDSNLIDQRLINSIGINLNNELRHLIN